MFQHRPWRKAGCLWLLLPFIAIQAAAQELAPRAYWPAPAGTKVLVTAYQYTTGDVVTDPSLPVVGVESNINYLQASYAHTFGLFGRTASATLNLPYTSGRSEGYLSGEFVARDIVGFADARARFAINLRGAPKMDGAGFRALVADPKTIIGASLLVSMPTGAYDPARVLNAGTNRWGVKPAIGAIWPLAPNWLLEGELGAWFYSDNDDFLGMTRKQDRILSTEIHLIRVIRGGPWIGFDANYYKGGESTIGDRTTGLQRNARAGATVFFPFKRVHALRGSFSTGVKTESGGDFDMVSLSYVYAW
jgi:hypothetical protein